MELEKTKITTLNVHGPTTRCYDNDCSKTHINYLIWLKPQETLTICDGVSEGYFHISHETIAKMCSSANVVL
jgi:hypothetical protein